MKSFSVVKAVTINLLLSFVVYVICRTIFYVVNISFFNDTAFSDLLYIYVGGARFDIAAIFYTNLLYILIMLLPFHFKERKGYYTICKFIFIVINSVAIIANLIDTIYFRYTSRRTTSTIFDEFANDKNVFSVISIEAINNWYLILLCVALIFALYKLYVSPKESITTVKKYYLVTSVFLICFAGVAVMGIRGTLRDRVKPIANNDANIYAKKSQEVALVLNTPFSIIRTLGKKSYVSPQYFENESALIEAYNPEHFPTAKGEFKKKNIVVLILEGFAKEYVGAACLNVPNIVSYTPFLDSLIGQSLIFSESYANGVKSIESLPAILASIPSFEEPLMVTPYANNKMSGIATKLREKGYDSAFFHGATNGSLGINSSVKTFGFDKYFGMDEYNQKVGEHNDYDGYWGIWDEEFLQYSLTEMANLKEPFISATFTVSSHHPFMLPEKYKEVLPKGSLPPHAGVYYTDSALKKFFEKAKESKWYDNTIFVICADHSNYLENEYFNNQIGRFAIPIIFYTPNGELTGVVERTVQQTDIMPTILGYLNYDKPYVAFGHDIFNSNAEDDFSVNCLDGIYQLYKDGYLLQFTDKAIALYNYKEDYKLKHNLLEQETEIVTKMSRQLKAIIQQYKERMIHNNLIIN